MELTFGNFLASNNVSVNKTDAQFTISSGAVSRTAPDFFARQAGAESTTAPHLRDSDSHGPGNLQGCRAELARISGERYPASRIGGDLLQ
jgi:hypothetical protein